jgi:HAD superfamily hydrolase (TIGR01450 family)
MTMLDRDRSIGERLAGVRGVMFDVDGCLILADTSSDHAGVALPGAAEAIAFVRSQHMPLVVFTNGSMQTPAAIAATLRDLGIDVTDDEVLTPAVVAAELANDRHPGSAVLVFGGPGIHDVFEAYGVPMIDIDAALRDGPVETPLVVVGWDTSFTRDKLLVAAEAVKAGANILVTSDAPTFASAHRMNVGVAGFIAAGLRHVTGQDYEIVGKPSAAAMSMIARRLGVQPADVLVVGDDLALESVMAVEAGAVSVLVTTGTSTRDDAGAVDPAQRPLVVDSLTELVDEWRDARDGASARR